MNKESLDERENLHDDEFFNERGIDSVESGRVTDALKDFDKAISINDEESAYFFNRGCAKSDLSDYKGAIKDVSKAISLDSYSHLYFYTRGSLFSKLQKSQKAIEDYDIAISMHKKDPDYYWARGLAYFELAESCSKSFSNFFWTYTSDFKFNNLEKSLSDLENAIRLVPLKRKNSYKDLFFNYETIFRNERDLQNWWLGWLIGGIICLLTGPAFLLSAIICLFVGYFYDKLSDKAIKNTTKANEIFNQRYKNNYSFEDEYYEGRGNSKRNSHEDEYYEGRGNSKRNSHEDKYYGGRGNSKRNSHEDEYYEGRGNSKRNSNYTDESYKETESEVSNNLNEQEKLLELGWECYLKKSFEEAITHYTEVIENNKENHLAYFRRGLARFQKTDYFEAQEDFDYACGIDTQNVAYLINLGLSKHLLGDFQGALKVFNKAIKIDPLNSKAYLNRGESNAELEKYSEALEDFNESIKIDPNDENAYYSRGNLGLKNRKYKDAVGDFDSVLKINPLNHKALNNRSAAKIWLLDYQGAFDDANHACMINEQYTFAFLNRGNARLKLRDFEGAIDDYQKSIDLDPTFKLAQRNYKATVEFLENRDRIGDLDVTYQEFEKTFLSNFQNENQSENNSLKQDSSDFYYNSGLDKFHKEDYKGAKEDLDKFIYLVKNDKDAYLLRSSVCTLLEEYEIALADINKAIELTNDEELDENLFARACIKNCLEKYNEAYEDLNSINDKELINSSSFLIQSGISNFYLGNNDKGLKDLQQAVELGDQDAKDVLKELYEDN